MALSSRTITASINYRCAPFSATLMHRGRRAALKTPSDACAEDCRGKLIWPRCPINACSPWCVPIITLPESVLTTKPRQRFSAVTCCTSNVNPPTGFRRYDGEDLNDLFNELWFQDTSMCSQCDYLPIPKVSLYSLVNSLKLGPTIGEEFHPTVWRQGPIDQERRSVGVGGILCQEKI